MALQLPGYYPDITVLSASPSEACADYLCGRENLADFVNINNSPDSGKEFYGSISFVREDDFSYKTELTDEHRYIFISSGSDDDITALAELPKEKWDDVNDQTLNDLDELDRTSLQLHRAFRRHSERQDFSPETELDAVYKIFVSNGIPLAAYNQFILCLKNILNGCYGYSVQYDYYEEAVREAAMYTSDSCRMKIISSYKDISVMAERFLNDARASADHSGIYVETFGNRISLCSGRLDVSDLQLNTNNSRDVKELLKQLAEKHYISSPVENESKISFSFTSRRMREMLTSAGMILEVYTYYEAIKTGYFDDVASGYEFTWSRDNVRNELDCVITKGFCSIIIECKARKQLDQNFYHKLYSIAEQFGINAKVVLIANTYDKLFANQNNEQIQRGQMMDIVTVSKREDIQNIGETLVKIIEGKFA
ncbi:MAG: DUF1887 family protein [Oscillospiraceae bacterium]|nr:DUF1887 family protein [Oscillospiraceae bacterium]